MANSNKKSSNSTKFDGRDKGPSNKDKTFRRPPWIESPIGIANGKTIESLAKRMERQAKKVKEDYEKMKITIDRIQDESKSVQEVIDKLQIRLD